MDKDQIMVFLLIDLNEFSKINDVYSRSVGDLVLKYTADNLKTMLTDNMLLARIGGDEFLMSISGLKSTEDAKEYILQIVQIFDHPIELLGLQVSLSVSVGASFWPVNGLYAEELLAKADIALLAAKQSGINLYKFYSHKMDINMREDLQIETELRAAIQLKQFVVHYQPIISLQGEDIIGVEALVRWQHPLRGLIPPLEFISVAEGLNLIQDITSFVLIESCRQITEWSDCGYPNMKLAVNLSAKQGIDVSLIKQLDFLLHSNKIKPEQLELELTESFLFQDSAELRNYIQEIKSRSIDISIDDFGTGYSSLSYLRNFNVDKLKIDRCFVSACNVNKDDRALIRAIIEMGKSMGLTILAEGIENKDQLDILKELGCEQGQGFYFSKPLPAEQCLEYIKSHYKN